MKPTITDTFSLIKDPDNREEINFILNQPTTTHMEASAKGLIRKLGNQIAELEANLDYAETFIPDESWSFYYRNIEKNNDR
jgi:hypothetical protein